MAGTDFLHIDPKVRQQFIPFRQSDSRYSFRPINENKLICPFPDTLREFFSTDTELPIKGYNEFLNLIPSVQIREYQPDARLTQTLKMFSYFKKGLDAAMEGMEGSGTNKLAKVSEIAKTAMEKASNTLKKFTSGEASALDVFAGVGDYVDAYGRLNMPVLMVPWILYYQLNTTTTSNVYEVPILLKESPLFYSDGRYGWPSTYGSTPNIHTDSMGLIGAALELLGVNEVKIDRMPIFNPNENNSNGGRDTDIEVKFTLVNDTANAAIQNFIFCHNLFGNNRWMQYGFVQVSSSLYDVAIPGANRYWMCTGKFEALAKGTLRTPSREVLDGIKSHGTAQADLENKDKDSQRLSDFLNQQAEAQQEAQANLDAAAADLGSLLGTNIDPQTFDVEAQRGELINALIAAQSPGAQEGTLAAANERADSLDNFVKAKENLANVNKVNMESYNAYKNAAEENTSNKVENLVQMIKIPDAYEVKLVFHSILPDNFNSFLYGWRAAYGTWDIMRGTKTAPGTSREWVYEDVVEKITEIFKKG